MYTVRDYLNVNGRIRRNMNIIAMQEFYHFTVSSVLQTKKKYVTT